MQNDTLMIELQLLIGKIAETRRMVTRAYEAVLDEESMGEEPSENLSSLKEALGEFQEVCRALSIQIMDTVVCESEDDGDEEEEGEP